MGKITKLLIALFTLFTLTLMRNLKFGKDWSTVTTIFKLSNDKMEKNSLNRSANSESAEFLDQQTSGKSYRRIQWNNGLWLKPLVFSEDENWPKIWKPGRKSKLKGVMESKIQTKAQHKGAMLKP